MRYLKSLEATNPFKPPILDLSQEHLVSKRLKAGAELRSVWGGTLYMPEASGWIDPTILEQSYRLKDNFGVFVTKTDTIVWTI